MQTHMSAALWLGLLALICAAGAANAQANVSGIYKDRQETIRVSVNGMAIAGIRSSKYDSSPCQLSIFERPLSGTSNQTNKHTLNKCPSKRSRAILISQFEDPSVFVRGVSVCLSKKNVRHLRPVWSGVRLYGAKVIGDEVTPLSEGSEIGFERSLCRDWQQPLFCPEGEIATGVVAHIREARVEDYQFTGLGLICDKPS